MRRRKWLLTGAAVVIAIAALYGFMNRPTTTTDFVMGSVLTQKWWGHNAADMALWNIQYLEQQLLNADEAPPLALEIMEASGGAFNPYLGALAQLWDIDGDGYMPTQEEIAEALQKQELNLGGYGKGAACDTANLWNLTFSPLNRPRGAVVNLGGNIAIYGRKPWGQPFKIALRDPKGGPNDAIGMFALRGTNFISTSGSYEKYFERDGVKYHHIFDPETGYPAERDPGLISVTVISSGPNGGAVGDAVSTACFVLGYEDSQALLAQYGCDAIFIYEDGTARAVGGVRDYFKLEHSSYHWS